MSLSHVYRSLLLSTAYSTYYHYNSLHHIKQELEGNCAKLQSIVRALEQAVSDAGKEVLHATETHQQMMDKERCVRT